uniref:Uncharacterized protein n=1 Tax=Hyaloperonospora arabidopsidis (strain Emoy2) TaxID=559515 RepID=M4B8V4_HYAAE
MTSISLYKPSYVARLRRVSILGAHASSHLSVSRILNASRVSMVGVGDGGQ